jgi:hypothetical protein
VNKKILFIIGLVVIFICPSSSEKFTPYWILEAATPLRSQPKAQSEVKAHLRTGDEFYSSKRSGDWVYMGVDQENGALRGWLPATMISESRVDRVFLLKQIRQAKSTADSIPWLARIVSLQPERLT